MTASKTCAVDITCGLFQTPRRRVSGICPVHLIFLHQPSFMLSVILSLKKITSRLPATAPKIVAQGRREDEPLLELNGLRSGVANARPSSRRTARQACKAAPASLYEGSLEPRWKAIQEYRRGHHHAHFKIVSLTPEAAIIALTCFCFGLCRPDERINPSTLGSRRFSSSIDFSSRIASTNISASRRRLARF